MFKKLLETKWGDRVSQVVVSLIASVVAFIPLWLILLGRWLLEPEGFWQKLVLYGLGFYFLGFIQFILAIVLIGVLVAIWSE